MEHPSWCPMGHAGSSIPWKAVTAEQSMDAPPERANLHWPGDCRGHDSSGVWGSERSKAPDIPAHVLQEAPCSQESHSFCPSQPQQHNVPSIPQPRWAGLCRAELPAGREVLLDARVWGKRW